MCGFFCVYPWDLIEYLAGYERIHVVCRGANILKNLSAFNPTKFFYQSELDRLGQLLADYINV